MSSWDQFATSLQDQQTAIRDLDASIMQAGANDEKLAALHVHVLELLESLQTQRKFIEQKLAEGVLVEIGAFPRHAGPFKITVEWPEKHDWNEDILAQLVGDDPKNLPTFVDRKLKVDKRAYDRADDAEKALVLPALTRKPGTRKVIVEKLA